MRSAREWMVASAVVLALWAAGCGQQVEPPDDPASGPGGASSQTEGGPATLTVETHCGSATCTETVQVPPDPDASVERDSSYPLQLPPAPLDLRMYAEDVGTALEGNSYFSAVELNRERTGITIHWYGDATQIQDLVSQVPSGFTVEVSGTVYEPGLLRAEATRLLDAGLVGSVGLDTSASKLLVTAPAGVAGQPAPITSPYPIEYENAEVP